MTSAPERINGSVKKEIAEREYDIRSLIVPAGRKESFSERAAVISGLSMEKISRFAPELMRWFQDLNWPGVEIVESKLRQLDEERLKEAIRQACEEALLEKDEEWLFNLKEVFGDQG